jgi:hypothetical protein
LNRLDTHCNTFVVSSYTDECDETFVGGKGDAKTKLSRKTPVVALFERDGNMKTKVVSNAWQHYMPHEENASTESVPKTYNYD